MHCGRWNHSHLNGKTKDVEALSRHLLSSLRRQHTWTGHPSSAGMKARCLGTARAGCSCTCCRPRCSAETTRACATWSVPKSWTAPSAVGLSDSSPPAASDSVCHMLCHVRGRDSCSANVNPGYPTPVQLWIRLGLPGTLGRPVPLGLPYHGDGLYKQPLPSHSRNSYRGDF